MHYAARVGSLDIIQYLIINKKVSPFVVSEVGKLDRILILMRKKKLSYFFFKFQIGATILHDAAVKGRIQVIEWLVKNTELNLGVKDTNGTHQFLVFIITKLFQ